MMTALTASLALLGAPARPSPGPAPVSNVVETLHGVAVPDPYRWLEDAAAPEVKAFMEAQDAAARAALGALPGRERLRARLAVLLGAESVSVPTSRGGRLFHTRRPAGAEKALLYVRDVAAGKSPAPDRLLLDPSTLSPDGTTALGAWVPSWRGDRLAYGRQPNHADEQSLHVRDVATGADLPDVLPGARWSSPSWTPDDAGFFYAFTPPAGPDLPEAMRSAQSVVKYHRLGDDAARDAIFHGPTGDAQLFLSAGVSSDGRWLIASISRGWTATDLYVQRLPAKGPVVAPGPWLPLIVGREANFTADAAGDRFYVRTDDAAPRGRVIAIDAAALDPTGKAAPPPQRWRVFVGEDPVATLDSASLAGGRLLLTYTREAVSVLEVRDLRGRHPRRLEMPPNAALEGLSADLNEQVLYFGASTLTSPRVVYEARVDRAGAREWARVVLPLRTEDLVSEQVFYPSKDGTRIPLFVVRRKTEPRDGSTPYYLTGYGGFDISLQPYFQANLMPWLEAGGGLAIANLRGGGEYGEAWHQAGMRGHKQNVFDDFIAAAEYLVREGHTRPERLAIAGRSNGGLLVGAALVQRPELFRAVICGVPLLDMLRFHRFGTGQAWIDEYGDPERAADFAWLHAYSPYHHVIKDATYPTVLFASADADDRVDPLHARKMAAALQAATRGGPVLLRVERNAGHGGADKVSAHIAQSVDELAFALAAVGLVPAE